ncbi:Cytoplasmic tRNA 2-thiolation protein 1 [Zostera marina]|uniref:Cytoplasmic tRNA 2-thiolation protein 1 n=1 Tax=Zostera marina TaxID=29655 RepID=A0A0K9PME7_ZOSMR|nr:Cytoplasmic tRNA 2-thiolation protein 1 [Zostera marina]
MATMEKARRRTTASSLCAICNQNKAALKRPKTAQQICRECFYSVFEDEIHNVITENNLFKSGERVAIGASGGKDSTVLAYVLSKLNHVHNYGVEFFLLSIDEGISGYRDDSLETVKRNEIQYGLPLKIVSYKDLYGWTMDEIVKAIGLKNNCTFCGVFRRQALDRGASLLKVDKLVTGHNADDIAETVLLNILRGDIARLGRCTYITTGIYSPNAYRGFAREFIKDLERIRPRAILDIIKSGENFRIATSTKMPEQGTCERCGYISSQEWCKACVLLDGLNRGLPKLGIGRTKTINGGGGSGGVKPGTKSRLSNVGMKESRTRSRQYSGSVDF